MSENQVAGFGRWQLQAWLGINQCNKPKVSCAGLGMLLNCPSRRSYFLQSLPRACSHSF
jgi:hypothetical protein